MLQAVIHVVVILVTWFLMLACFVSLFIACSPTGTGYPDAGSEPSACARCWRVCGEVTGEIEVYRCAEDCNTLCREADAY